MNNYKYVLFQTNPGIGFGAYNDDHHEVHRMISSANVDSFEEMLSDYYASVKTIIVSTDEIGVINYCKDNGIELDIEYERKWYGCYEHNGVYGGKFNRADSFDYLREVEEAPRDKPVESTVKYDVSKIYPTKKEVIYD